MFKVSDWFSRVWNGTLFGGRKDKLILQILKLGGRDLLISQCGLPLDRDTIDAAPVPSMKMLSAVLRKAKLERRKVDKAAAKAESILALANPDDYTIVRDGRIDKTGEGWETEIWTPRKSSPKRRKRSK